MNNQLISEINTDEKVRDINSVGLSKLVSLISSKGYLDSHPVVIDQDNILVCGQHRILACKELDIKNVPALVKTFKDKAERTKFALDDNAAEDGSIPMTFVDFAELIWRQETTQQETADILGWSVARVKDFSRLKKVAQKAWSAIVANVNSASEEVANASFFSEGILRPLISLTPEQQLDLVEGLISKKYSKPAFKKQAENYQQQNKDIEILNDMLYEKVAEDIYKAALEEVLTGKYDLNAVIQYAIDKHNKETSIRLIHGDCIEELKKIEDESIDLIATDPPYNMDKADWDSYGSGEEFALWAEQWLVECKRVLKPQGSIYIFGINRMLSHIQKWLDVNMVYRNWIVWDTIQGAGGGLWINRHEAILYYSKTDDTYEDNNAVKLERHEENIREYKGKEYKFKNPSNIWRFPCVDNKNEDRTDHITQKPVEIMERIIKASSPAGGIVCDPFLGSATTAIAAYKSDRRFIGYELDNINYDIALKRVNHAISS